jgi:hypothetical protein
MILRHLLLPDILDLVESGSLNDVREFLALQAGAGNRRSS